MAELHTWTAAETAHQIAAKQVSAGEVTRALLDRIDAVEPSVLAWARLDADGALAQARALDERLARGEAVGPLAGVGIGVKDIYHVAGLPTRAGSAWYHRDPDFDATSVARLRAAGAIILGKTHTTEFASRDPSPARNPWNPAHTPGGSSSGSAAGVAARMMPGALGTQTAGSVLRPAAYCGIVGLKPTYGRVSRFGVLPLSWTLDHVGPLTRTVEDAALLLAAMAGPDGKDDACPPAPIDDWVGAARTPAAPRIGLVGDVYPELVDDETRAVMAAAASTFERAGATMKPLALPPEFAAALDTHQVINAAEVAGVHAELVKVHGDGYRDGIRGLIETGVGVPGSVYLRAQQARRVIRDAVTRLFDQVDVLLVPAAPGAAPVTLAWTGDPALNAPWSLFGYPCISLPAGFAANGLPLGVQLVAAPWAEATLLRAAAWCEGALPPASAPAL